VDNSSSIVFVLDDDPDVCLAMSRLLRAAGHCVRTFGSATEFLADYNPDIAGCLLLDIAMPDFDGLEVQAMLNNSGCHLPVIFLTGNGSIPMTVAAIRAGAVNFLTKPVPESRLLEAVGEALNIDAAGRRNDRMRHALERRLDTLTPRERQVLEHVVRGRLNKQIAAELGTVEKTVKVHRARVMHKMGARSLAELVHLANAVGLFISTSTQSGAAASNGGSAWSYCAVSESRAVNDFRK
jgi:FixJ family two-component response regulator